MPPEETETRPARLICKYRVWHLPWGTYERTLVRSGEMVEVEGNRRAYGMVHGASPEALHEDVDKCVAYLRRQCEDALERSPWYLRPAGVMDYMLEITHAKLLDLRDREE